MSLQIKRSATTGSIPASLLAGEPSWNSADRTLYLADDTGAVRRLPAVLARSCTPVTVNTASYTSIGSFVVPASWLLDDECIRVTIAGTVQTSSSYIWLKILWGGVTVWEDGVSIPTHANARPWTLEGIVAQDSAGEFVLARFAFAAAGTASSGIGEGGSPARVVIGSGSALTVTTRTGDRTIDIQVRWNAVAAGETLTAHLYEVTT